MKIYLFTRDLRLIDNAGLVACCRAEPVDDEVMLLFCLNPRQLKSSNKYRSNFAIGFMVQALRDLSVASDGALHVAKGKPEKVLAGLEDVTGVYLAQDYTPFAQKRVKKIRKAVGCPVVEVPDVHTLTPKLLDVRTKTSDKVYTVFTPFYKNVSQLAVPLPFKMPKKVRFHKSSQVTEKGHDVADWLPADLLDDEKVQLGEALGGRGKGLKLLQGLKTLAYAKDRNTPSKETSKLAAHHKFGTVSVRETYRAAFKHLRGENREMFVRQLWWRDFFYAMAFHFPHVFGQPFDLKYQHLNWATDSAGWLAWKTGTTGFPLVDAGIRELLATGSMHNRVRMVVASFLVKDLRLHWLDGERFFAQHLVDYDPCVNCLSWQWVTGVGVDRAPYFRILSPWSQAKRFDPDGAYTHLWVPELAEVSGDQLAKWDKVHSKFDVDYPAPIIDHAVARKATLKMYKEVVE